jgi:hypothetical protein
MASVNESEIAKFILKPMGEVPINLRQAVQSLMVDHESNGIISTKSYDLSVKLANIVGIRGALYYAALTFEGEEAAKKEYFSPKDLVYIFKPLDLAAILTAVYWFRRIKRFCPEEDWKQIERPAAEESELSGYIGQNLREIGLGTGLLVGLFPKLTLGLFAKYKQPELQTYLKYLEETRLLTCMKKEQELFNCTHADINALMLIASGFGFKYSTDFADGLRFRNDTAITTNHNADKFRYAALWLESLRNNHKILEDCPKGFQIASDDKKEELVNLAKLISDEGSEFSWVSKTKDDITPSKIPNIFTDEEKANFKLPAGD